VIYDIAIIGSGPAGLTAAIYTSRAELDTLVIGGSPPGGQLTTTTDVENFPGFPEGIMGPDLIANMRKQAQRFGAVFQDENVTNILGSSDDGFVLQTDATNSYSAKSIIVATGASAKWLGLESEQKLRGKGVSACATCDGFFFKDKIVAVVGGGDAAMEEAVYLTKFAPKVYVLVRGARDSMRASKIMQKRAHDNPKVEFLCDTEVIEVLGDAHVSGVRIKNNKTDEATVLKDVQGLFVAIGHKPNTGFLKGFVELDQMGYAKIIGPGTQSSVAGVFISGDVHDHRYRQAITAAGYGCMASLDAERWLATLPGSHSSASA